MTHTAQPAGHPGAGLISMLAAACGLMAANLYYAQPLAGPIGAALGMSPAMTGFVVTLTQIGYGIGLVFIVPLGDLIENRLLLISLILMSGVALLGAAFSSEATGFLAAALLIGLTSVAAQAVVPFAAHLAPEATRGRVVGNVISGLMLGIMLARPAASLIAGATSWHVVFALSAVAMLGLAIALRLTLPKRHPQAELGYGALIASMGRLALHTPVLQRRAAYQFFLFAAFSLFWTVTPLYLTGPAYGLDQRGVALFALAGVAGAIASPIAGRLADAGLSRPATGGAMVLAALSFAMTHIAGEGSWLGLGLLTAAAILLDYGATTCLVLGQRAIFSLGHENRSRLNGLFIASFFVGGALGSAVGGWAYAAGGWGLASLIGGALPLLALVCFGTELMKRPRAR